jgi:hypothetical protein
VIPATARLSSCFSGSEEKLRLTGPAFPSRGGDGPKILAVGLFLSKAAMRDLTDTLGTARKAR